MGAMESKNAFKLSKTVYRSEPEENNLASSIASISISQDEVFIATSRHNLIDLWDANFTDFVKTLEGHQDAITCLRQTPDRRFILSCSADGTIRIWVKPGGRWACKEVISAVHRGWAWQAEWLADIGFVSVGTDGHLVVWKLDACGKLIEPIFDCTVHTKSATCLTLLHEKYKVTLVTGSNDMTLVVSELTISQAGEYMLKFVSRLGGHEAEINCTDSFMFPRLYGSIIVSGGRDRTIRLWSLADINRLDRRGSTAVPHVVHALRRDVVCVKFSQEGRFFVASTDDEITVFLSPIPGLKIESRKLSVFSPALSGPIRSLCWGARNTVLFLGTEDGAVAQIQVPKLYHRHKRLTS